MYGFNAFLVSTLIVKSAIAFPSQKPQEAAQPLSWTLKDRAADKFEFSLTSDSGAGVRFNKHEGFCETTPGVKSYSGFVDLNEKSHTFFWFFESRNNPSTDPVTLWLNGGPGADAHVGLLAENVGPCTITDNLTTVLNPFSWNQNSNLLVISAPIGVGFSYSTIEEGSLDPDTGEFVNSTAAPPTGLYPVIDDSVRVSESLEFADATYNVLQGLFGVFNRLETPITSSTLHLFAESYGGHYGPATIHHTLEQNELIRSGELKGRVLDVGTLGVLNGCVDSKTQLPLFTEFARRNTYGIHPLSEEILAWQDFALTKKFGVLENLDTCNQLKYKDKSAITYCTDATALAWNNIIANWIAYSNVSYSDIRAEPSAPSFSQNFVGWLNLPEVQTKLGVETVYSLGSGSVGTDFYITGDYSRDTWLTFLGEIADGGVAVSLVYADADYSCNWLGGEAVSLATSWSQQNSFKAAGYESFISNGEYKGDVRQKGRFSFTRMFDGGHEGPVYQPKAYHDWFDRSINGSIIASGNTLATPEYATVGPSNSTHINVQ